MTLEEGLEKLQENQILYSKKTGQMFWKELLIKTMEAHKIDDWEIITFIKEKSK